ncbi:MAG: hypothetical protein IJI58_01085 [Bacilli bacterium]|nr:hypothetical protein [Bacilli bacterium]
MIELIEEIEKHKSKNNSNVCEELIERIKDYNIKSKEELLTHENSYFYENDLDKKIDQKYKSYVLDYTRLDNATNSDIIKLKEYEANMKKATNNLEKCKYLILIYDYVGYELAFPYEAYLLIVSDNLN